MSDKRGLDEIYNASPCITLFVRLLSLELFVHL